MENEKFDRDISTPEKLSEYLNNLRLNFPNSHFRKRFEENRGF
jgi:hypothetical protein